jgi:hypothetical protein
MSTMPKDQKRHAVPTQTVQSSAIKHDMYSFPLDRNMITSTSILSGVLPTDDRYLHIKSAEIEERTFLSKRD